MRPLKDGFRRNIHGKIYMGQAAMEDGLKGTWQIEKIGPRRHAVEANDTWVEAHYYYRCFRCGTINKTSSTVSDFTPPFGLPNAMFEAISCDVCSGCQRHDVVYLDGLRELVERTVREREAKKKEKPNV